MSPASLEIAAELRLKRKRGKLITTCTKVGGKFFGEGGKMVCITVVTDDKFNVSKLLP